MFLLSTSDDLISPFGVVVEDFLDEGYAYHPEAYDEDPSTGRGSV
jgi:hypothetical protein